MFARFPELMFGMSTNTGGVSPGTLGLNLSLSVGDDPENVRKNRELFFAALPAPLFAAAFTRQEHTVNVQTVTAPGISDSCDALITDRTGVFLTISIADCTPVMLYDPARHVIAGIHAGWRGTAGRIVEWSILRMTEQFGTQGQDIVAFIGPSAGPCCYEVGPEVAVQFPPECASPGKEGRFMLDVKEANRRQLLECGVPNSNIEVHSDCTIHLPLYHSHRRDGKGSGRMLAVIGIHQ